MTVLSITALIGCDGCGKEFKVEMDPAQDLPTGTLVNLETGLVAPWTMFDAVEDAVRGGSVVNGGLGDSSSVQDEKMLCPLCTREEDAEEYVCIFELNGGACSCPKCAPLVRKDGGDAPDDLDEDNLRTEEKT